MTNNHAQDQQRQIFGDALQFWADVSSLTFSEVNNASDADIKIRLVNETFIYSG